MPRGTTPFVLKTWDLLANKELAPIVTWTRNGEAFAILDGDKFASDVLPKYFKHSNLCSFVRQLNTYGFKKVTIRDCNDLEFKHKLFHRDHEELLPHIVRRTNGSKEEVSEGSVHQEELVYQLVETNKKLTRRLKQLEQQRLATDRELYMIRHELRQTKELTSHLSVFQRKANYPPHCPPPQHQRHNYPHYEPVEASVGRYQSTSPPRRMTPLVPQTLSSELNEWPSFTSVGSSPAETSPEQPLPFPLQWESLDITEDFFSAM